MKINFRVYPLPYGRGSVSMLIAVSLLAQPNPYRTVENFFKLPEGRTWGSTRTVAVDSKGHIWIAAPCGGDRCVGQTAGRTRCATSTVEVDSKGHILIAQRLGANTCVGKTVDPILEFDDSGKLMK